MKRIITVLLAIIMCLGNVTNVYAWKGATHAYIADMLIEELKTGRLTIDGAGSFVVPDEIRNAILNYPNAFRAGSLGPDHYPDIYYGQSVIHPEANGTAGSWIDIMLEKYRELSPDDPEREKAFSFVLGMMMHYSGDIFAHDFVNKWARGSFPNLTDGATPEETKIIMRHMIIENYIDAKVPIKHKTDVKIDSPKRFILDTFIYNQDVKRAPYIEVAGDTRNRLMDAVSQFKAFNGDGNPLDYITYPFTTNYSNYMEYWADDIDAALEEWINTSERVALAFTDDNISKKQAIKDLEAWQENYLNYVTPAPDVIVDTIRIPGKAVDAIFSALGLDELKEKWSQIKMGLFVTAIEKASGMSLQEIIELEEHYEERLSDEMLFEEKAKEKLDKYLKNFGRSESTLDQEFVAFNNTIVMSKLCLIGADNLNLLMKNLAGVNGIYSRQSIIGSYDRFQVTVHTKSNGWFEFNGTDDDIFFGIKMKDGSYYETLMDKKNYNDFEGGDRDTYEIILSKRIKLEDIAYVQLRKRSIVNDDWTPTYMKLSYKGTEIKSWRINNEFTGNEVQKFNMNGVKEHAYGTTAIDPNILNFTRSLDESNQINLFEFYSNPIYREKIYNKIFMEEENFHRD